MILAIESHNHLLPNEAESTQANQAQPGFDSRQTGITADMQYRF